VILTLVNIGPLKEARVELGRGLTVFYGPNASGKTTVARALRLLALMNMGVANVGELMELINRVKREGRIVYEDGGSVLEISCALGERGAWLKFGGVLSGERRVYPDDRLESTDRPRIAMFWILHNSVTLYGLKAQEGRSYELADLLAPLVLRGLVGEGKALGEFLDFYEELLAEVNKYLEAFSGHVLEYRDGLYFRRGIHLFHPNQTAKGVRRMALIIAATLLAEAVAERSHPGCLRGRIRVATRGLPRLLDRVPAPEIRGSGGRNPQRLRPKEGIRDQEQGRCAVLHFPRRHRLHRNRPKTFQKRNSRHGRS
jgi:energy-coupling factor transporter ATP-binding protein EcfA2